MGLLDGRARAARNRQKKSLVSEAAKIGTQVVEIAELGDDVEAGNAVLAGAFKSYMGGRRQFDFAHALHLQTNSWSHYYVQPYSGLTPLPGEHHGLLTGSLPTPALLRPTLLGGSSWEATVGSEVAAYLEGSPVVKAAARSMVWDWKTGLTVVELEWGVQLRSVGDGTTHLAMQAGRYGGTTSYKVGFAQWLKLCQALQASMQQGAYPAQSFAMPTRFDMLTGIPGTTPSQAQAASTHAMATESVSDKLNAAAKLLLSKQYQASIDSYNAIAQQHPEETGTCFAQIGASLFFLNQFGQAIQYYQAAKQHGAEPSMMDENIQEAQQAAAASGHW